jgi:hypothetical protein
MNIPVRLAFAFSKINGKEILSFLKSYQQLLFEFKQYFSISLIGEIYHFKDNEVELYHEYKITRIEDPIDASRYAFYSGNMKIPGKNIIEKVDIMISNFSNSEELFSKLNIGESCKIKIKSDNKIFFEIIKRNGEEKFRINIGFPIGFFKRIDKLINEIYENKKYYSTSIDSRKILALGAMPNIPLLEKWGHTGNAMLELFENNVRKALNKMVEEIEREENEGLVIGHISKDWHDNEELRKEIEPNFSSNLKKAIDNYEIIIKGLVNETRLRNVLSEEYELRGYKVSYEPTSSGKYMDIVIKRDKMQATIHMENMVNKLLFKGYDIEALINEMIISAEVFYHSEKLMKMLKNNEEIDFISYVPYKREITFNDVPIFKMPF